MTGTSKVLAYIHETAVVAPTARIARDVEIGPYAVISDHVQIGEGTKIGPHAVIKEWTQIGRDCQIFQGASIGEVPQDLKFKRPVVPGDVVVTKAELVRVRGVFGVLHADAYVGEDLVASADFKFALKNGEDI